MTVVSGNEDLFRRSMNQGHSAAWEGRWDQAVEHYGRALKEFPENPPTLNSLALAHFELGNLEKAMELYKHASRLSPEDPLPVEKMAQIYRQTGRTKESAQYSMKAAELYLSLRDADKAIKNWTRVIRLEPENIDAHARLALVYEKLGRTPQAVTEHIAVAALQQHAGMLDEARSTGEHALQLNPKNREAQQAVAMLQARKQLPKPVRQGGISGPLRLPAGPAKPASNVSQKLEFEKGPDPIEEATQSALRSLAAMLFDLTPLEGDAPRRTNTLRSFARVVSTGLMTRGFDEKAIVRHLNQAIQLGSQGKSEEASAEFKAVIEAGLDHPAAHFMLGVLLFNQGQKEAAQPSFQKAVKHADFSLASRLLQGNYLIGQNRPQEAVVEYLQALKIANSAVVSEDKGEALRGQYEPLIAEEAQNTSETETRQLCENIRHLLMRSNWRIGVHEARGQLPGMPKNAPPTPLAEILTHANSGRLVDALAYINELSREGYSHTAMEEAFAALQFSPAYLPLHIHIGELLLMNDRPGPAIQKLSTVARTYSARGESDRATQMYERIVDVSPLDVDSRTHLVEQLTAQGQVKQAINHILELADVYYRLAQLDQARETYEKALRLSQGTEMDTAWTVQILHQIADIDMQRLDWRKALLVYEQVRTLAPEDETARLNLVQLNLRIGQEGKASTELENYLSLLNSPRTATRVPLPF